MESFLCTFLYGKQDDSVKKQRVKIVLFIVFKDINLFPKKTDSLL